MSWRLAPSLRQLASNRVLLLVLGIQTALIALRTLNLYVTGFMTPDESNYILDLFVGLPTGGRLFLHYEVEFLFKVFSIDTISRFLIFFPFYLALWSFSFIILAYKTVSLITQNRYARDFAMFSLPFAIAYSILSVGFLSEGPGLTMCMAGIYTWLRYARVEKRLYLAGIGSAAFVAAAYSREPYAIFPVMASAAWIVMGALRRAPIHHVALFVVISLTVAAAPTSPIYGATYAINAIASTVVSENQVATTTTTIVTANSLVTGAQSSVTNGTSIATTSSHTHTLNATSSVTNTIVGNVTSTITGTLTPVLTTSASSAVAVVSPSPHEGFFRGWAQVLTNSAVLFVVGMALGWNPLLLLVGAVALFSILRVRPMKKIPWLQLFIILLLLATFYADVYTFYNQFNFYLTQGLSNLIRLTNTTIPAYLLLSPMLYEKLSDRRIKMLAITLVALTAGSSAFYVSAVQTNFQLPYNVLAFGNLNAPLVARNYFLQHLDANSSTIVFLSPGWAQAQLYLQDIPGMGLYPVVQDFRIVGTMDLENISYENALFLRLHPSVFYVLSENMLADWNANVSLEANVYRLMVYHSVFLYKTYGKLFQADISAYGDTPFTIDSVQIVFSSPTGHLLEVHATWTGSYTA